MTRENKSAETQEVVDWEIDKEAFISILRHAAARDRTVIEFRTRERDDGTRVFDTAMDITEHVRALEDD